MNPTRIASTIMMAMATAAALGLAACSSDDSASGSTEKHFAEGQKKALDEAAKVGDTLRDAAQAQKKAVND